MNQTTVDQVPANLGTPQSVSAEGSAPLAIEVLLWRMRSGDREAAAEFLMQYGSRIRRRIRGKLGPSIRRIFDSMDILSTLGRRLDLYVMSGRLKVDSERELWSLLGKMANHALIDKARVFQGVRSIESSTSEFAYEAARKAADVNRDPALRPGAGSAKHAEVHIEVEECLAWLSDPVEKRILSRWLVGESYAAIGQPLGLGEDAIRKRLDRIQTKLKARYQEK